MMITIQTQGVRFTRRSLRSATRTRLQSTPTAGASSSVALLNLLPLSSQQQQQYSTTIRSMTAIAAAPFHPVYDLSQQELQWQKDGLLDERGLVKFDTLHNMQVRSCQVFADKNLFATYSATTQQFEWMSFAECTYICGLESRSWSSVGIQRAHQFPSLLRINNLQ